MTAERPTPQASAPAGPTASSAACPTASGEFRALLTLALPLAAAQLGQVVLSAVDTAVVGRLGQVELGAAGLGSSIFFTFSVLAMGIMLGLDPMVAQAVGSGDGRRARGYLWQGAWLALALGVPLTALTAAASYGLEAIGISPDSAAMTRAYLWGRVPGLVPFLLFVGARSYLQATGGSRWVLGAVVAANIVNLPMSWYLAFGGAEAGPFGLPALPAAFPAFGITGAAWASTAATVFQLLVLVAAIQLQRNPTGTPTPPGAPAREPDRAALARALRLGLPIGLTLVAEYCVFALVNLLMGWLGTRALAGHQVAITLASATFMVPLGVGAAAAVRVGQAIGRGDASSTRRAGLLSIGAGAAFMVVAALCFRAFPHQLASIFTDKTEAITAAIPLILVAAVFQLSDGVQAVAAGALRGAGDTRFPLVANLAGHYGIGLPLGVVLAFYLGFGPVGLWWGLSAGLTCVAVGLSVRFLILSRQAIAPIVDGDDMAELDTANQPAE